MFESLEKGICNNKISKVQNKITNKGKNLDEIEKIVYMNIVSNTENVFIDICKDLDVLRHTSYSFSEMLISVSILNFKLFDAWGIDKNIVFFNNKEIESIIDIESKFKRLKLLYSWGNESFKNNTPIFYKYLVLLAKLNGVKLNIEKEEFCSEHYKVVAYLKNIEKFDSFMDEIKKRDNYCYIENSNEKILKK